MSLSYDYMSECAPGFFTRYLKSDPSLFDSKLLAGPDNDYIQPVSLNFTITTTLCNTLLDNNLDLADRLVEDNKTGLFARENQLNLLARMFIDKDMAIWLYQKSLKYNPDSWKTYYNLGYTYNDKGETNLAKNALLKAQEINPENTKITDFLNEISREE